MAIQQHSKWDNNEHRFTLDGIQSQWLVGWVVITSSHRIVQLNDDRGCDHHIASHYMTLLTRLVEAIKPDLMPIVG